MTPTRMTEIHERLFHKLGVVTVSLLVPNRPGMLLTVSESELSMYFYTLHGVRV